MNAPSPSPPTILRLALAATTLTLFVALPALAVERSGGAWLHIAIDEAPPRGATVRINLPLPLVEAAVALLPAAEAGRARVVFDDADVSLAELAATWRRLGDRSGKLLSVEEPGRRTVVSRRGGFLVIDSRDRRHGDDRVVVRLTAPVVDALLAGPGDTLDLAAALRALATAGAGKITADTDGGDRVRIWIDHSPGAQAAAESR